AGMSGLVVIVPSRGRPHAVGEMAEAFEATCTAETELVFAIDEDDPTRDGYPGFVPQRPPLPGRTRVGSQESGTMVTALNGLALIEATRDPRPRAIAFMGDDH